MADTYTFCREWWLGDNKTKKQKKCVICDNEEENKREEGVSFISDVWSKHQIMCYQKRITKTSLREKAARIVGREVKDKQRECAEVVCRDSVRYYDESSVMTTVGGGGGEGRDTIHKFFILSFFWETTEKGDYFFLPYYLPGEPTGNFQ